MGGRGYWPAKPNGPGCDRCLSLSDALEALRIQGDGLVIASTIQNPFGKRFSLSGSPSLLLYLK